MEVVMKNQYVLFDALKFLKKYMFAHKGSFLKFYLGWLFQSIIMVITPTLFGKMVDEVVYNNNQETFFQIGFLVAGLYLCCWILYFFIYRQHNYLMTKFAYQIKKELFEHFLIMKAEKLNHMEEGEWMSLITWYPMECVHLLVRGVIHQINRMISIILIVFAIVQIDLLMGAIVLSIVCISIILSKMAGEKINHQALLLRRQNEKNQSWILEMLSGMMQIKLLSAEPYVREKLGENIKHVFDIRAKSNQITVKYSNLLLASRTLLLVLLYAYLAFLSFQSKLTIGELTTILAYHSSLMISIANVYDNWKNAVERVPFVQKIQEFLNTPTEKEWTGTQELGKDLLSVQFDEVSFRYEDKRVLNQIAFTIRPGEKIGLVGESGCGKTTIASLLMGLFEPEEGVIRIQNKDMRKFRLESLRERIGLISQQVSIIDGTIRENLSAVREESTLDELMKACQYAGIWDYIQSLPQGLDTMIGRNGIELSGGEKQRLSIARIYLKQPEIIIFDESTSALDFETEKQIMGYWDNILNNHTAIIITHRLTTLSCCDEIFVMKDGSIIEQGTLSQLRNKGTYFNQLFRIQEGKL